MLTLPIDDDEPMPADAAPYGYMETLEAASNTVRLLESCGLDLTFNDTDLDDAAATARQAARDPQALQRKGSVAGLTKKTPAALLLTEKILNDYGHQIVTEAAQVRHMVVNKLVQETENPDARIRIKALELLGKVSDVGLFTEKQEVTVTHQTSADLRERLRQKLERIMVDVTPPEDAEVVYDDQDQDGEPYDE